MGMETSNWINLGILIVALTAAIAAWVGASRSNKQATRSSDAAVRANRIQDEMLEIHKATHADRRIDEKRASLKVEHKAILHSLTNAVYTEYFFHITNSGKCTAENIRLRVEGIEIEDAVSLVRPLSMDGLVVGPDSTVNIKHGGFKGDLRRKRPVTVTVSWRDESGGNSWTGSVG